jgi:hypothetical protein
MSMIILAPVYLALALIGQAPDSGQDTHHENAERLKFMKDSVRSYELTRDGDRVDVLKLNSVPVFRMGKQGAQDIEEGAIFLWIGEAGRPEAAIQVFEIRNPSAPNGLWLHEFTSLSPRLLTAVRDGRASWSPRTRGLEFKPLPDAPKPAGSASQRARQMRSLAENFRVSDNFKAKGWSELRFLPRPIARYGEPKAKVLDGALFAFVLGTDPEVFLFVEARTGDDGPEWQYALAPMTVYAIKGSYRGKSVWELPDRQPCWDPTKPFFDCVYRP